MRLNKFRGESGLSHSSCSAIIIWTVFVISFGGNFPPCTSSPSTTSSLNLKFRNLETDFSSPALKCGETTNLQPRQTVFIESPNFSKKKKYPNSINCKWTFRLQQCTLAISCPSFSLNKFLCFDYVEVSDSMGRTKRFCGDEGPENLNMEKEVTVTFRSSPSFNGAGFRCYASCIEQVCGRGTRGSKYALQDKFPWVAQLFRKDDHQLFCSAVLISDRNLISASHCFSSRETNEASKIYVKFDESFKQLGKKGAKPSSTAQPGSSKINKEVEEDRRRNVSLINRYHSSGSIYQIDADVSLLKLEHALNFDMEDWDLSPICLPKEEDSLKQFTGVKTISSHWDPNSQSHRLLNMETTVMSNANCSTIYKSTPRLSSWADMQLSAPSMLCAQSSVKDFCQPVSGAALMAVENKGRKAKFTLIGVGSNGYDCLPVPSQIRRRRQNKAKPQIYTRVTEMADWIRENTKGSAFCKD